jgi:hypothetical protein
MKDIRDAFPSKYLKASDLKGKSGKIQIDRVEYEAVGQSKDIKPVMYFAQSDKGLVLNKTNCNTLIILMGSPDPDEWQGHWVTLYPTETSFQGDQVECIRIKKDAPIQGKPARRAAVDDETPIRKRASKAPPVVDEPVDEPDPDPDDDGVPF